VCVGRRGWGGGTTKEGKGARAAHAPAARGPAEPRVARRLAAHRSRSVRSVRSQSPDRDRREVRVPRDAAGDDKEEPVDGETDPVPRSSLADEGLRSRWPPLLAGAPTPAVKAVTAQR
jgi:hypothetical protein